MASARSCSGRAPSSSPRSRRIVARLFRWWRRRGDPGRRPPRRWPARVPAAAGPPPAPPGPAGSWPGCSGRWRRRGGPGRRRPQSMASARSCSGRAPAGSPRSRRIVARLFRSSADVGVVRAVGGLADGQRAFLQRPGPRQIPQVPQDQGQVVQAGWRRRGGPGRRRPRRWPARVLAAAGPPPDPPGPAGSGPGCSGGWRRSGWSGP